LGENSLSLYNSKTHGGLDIQLPQLFKDAGMGDICFAKGVSMNMWAGIFTRIQKSAPGPFSPSLSAKRHRSLLIAKRIDPYSSKYTLRQKGGSSRVLMTSNLLLRRQ
jgi:hypothetical protein